MSLWLEAGRAAVYISAAFLFAFIFLATVGQLLARLPYYVMYLWELTVHYTRKGISNVDLHQARLRRNRRV